MKWSKNWVAAMMLAPGIILASCGSGGDNNETTDTLSTQSAPPYDERSSTSDISTDTVSSVSPQTGTTGTTPQSGTTPGSTSSDVSTSGTERSVTGTTGETSKARTTTARKRSYNRGTTGRTRTTDRDRTRIGDRTTTEDRTTTRDQQDTSSAITRRTEDTMSTMMQTDTTNTLRDVTDTAASGIRRLGDTAASAIDRMSDTASQRLREIGDTASSRLRDTFGTRVTDTSSTATFDSTRGKQGNISGMTEKERTGNFADTTGQGTDTLRGNMSTMDAGINFTPFVFIPDQIRANYAEIKMARMAIEQSGNDQVRRIARSIENDHNALLRQLQTLAKSGNLPADSIPTVETDEAKSHLDMMKGKTGQAFDNQWLQHMHTMHEQKIQWLENAETNNIIQDAALREWVRKTLPTLRKHRDQIAQAMSSTNK